MVIIVEMVVLQVLLVVIVVETVVSQELQVVIIVDIMVLQAQHAVRQELYPVLFEVIVLEMQP